MKSKLILSATIAIFALTSCLVAEEGKYPPINPALTYWQAAAEMPDLKGEKADLLKDIIGGKKPFDAAKAKEILAGSDQALRLFAKAAVSPAKCDWGLPLEEGPEMGMPHVSKIMELSRLAILKANALFAEGETAEGISWLLASHRSARHAGVGDFLISELVQTAIETSTINAAARHCLGWNDETRKGYAESLKNLPPLHSLQDAFRGETLIIDWMERLLSSGDSQGRRKISELLASLDKSSSETDAKKEERFGEKILKEFSGEGGKKEFAEWRDLYRRTQEALGKPWKESQSELEALGKESQQGNILTKLSFPAFGSVDAKQFEIATLRTMLEAALQYGPKLDETTAASYKDAFEGEPLVLKKNDDGSLTLKAARQYRKGKEIELKLGK